MTEDARPGGTGHNGDGSGSAAPQEDGVPSGVPKEEGPPENGDAALFEKLAGIVDDGLRADCRIGDTLKKISDGKLYRVGYATWEKYLRVRHKMSTSHAHRMIDAADTARLVSPMGDKMRERHLRAVRPLALESAERARGLLRELIEGAGGVTPTTRQIEAGVDRALGRDPLPDWNAARDRLAGEHGEQKVRPLDPERLMGGRISRKDRDELARQRLLERAAQANGIVRGRHFPRFERVDFNALGVERESVELLLTDPPYKGEFLHLWKELGAFAARVLKPEGFLVAYMGSYHFDEAYGGLLAAGLRTRWIMGVKHLHGSPTVHRSGFSNSLKPILSTFM